MTSTSAQWDHSVVDGRSARLRGASLATVVVAVMMLCVSNPRAAAPPEQGERKEVEFLGFSKDESVCAWLVHVSRVHDLQGGQFLDTFDLIKVLRTATREPVATFRASRIRRRRLGGRKVSFSQKELHVSNPDWKNAQREREWRQARRQARFDAMLLGMKDSTVRLSIDNDLQVHVIATDEYLEAEGRPGAALGFRPIARLMDGKHISLGHYRVDGKPGVTMRAVVEVYHSSTARHVAILCNFFPKDAPGRIVSMGTALQTPDEPLGTNAIGTEKLMKNTIRLGGELFEDLLGNDDPEVLDMYERYVGKDW